MKGPNATAWLAARDWKPFAFQRQVWTAMARGQSGLLHATTGSGKTFAVWLGALQALIDAKRLKADAANSSKTASTEIVVPDAHPNPHAQPNAAPLTVIWITPMRALAADTLRALKEPLTEMAPHWSAGARSGDTTSGERSAQDRRLPTVLVTTPESLSVLLSRADAADNLGRARLVVVDEWHELMGNKRGVQTQLAVARLRHLNADLMVWGMSATLGNLDVAQHTLLGPGRDGVLVQGKTPKRLTVDTLLPPRTDRFPWAGHLGISMLPQVVEEIERSGNTLVFTNTRSQAELWYQALLDARPDWAGLIALHHGSLDHGVREWVEAGLKSGALRAVVCTSSLDLGVDFLPVERVLQIGSPKGIARLLQRAGRSGHAPGRPSRITIVPTHALELIEGAAARDAVAAGHIEAREVPQQPLDVLVQHLVTVALGGGFMPEALLHEVRSTAAYAQLSDADWAWCLAFVRQGGEALGAYPDFHRVQVDANGVWRVPDARLARRHRMNIGTIVSDASMAVQFVGGARLGQVEESFAARLKPGDCFLFAGRLLELVRVHEMTAWVRRAQGQRPAVPRWNGGKMPLSTTLADAVVDQLELAADGRHSSPELRAAKDLLAVQSEWSALPTRHHLLAEVLHSREGTHLFLYPFAGRHVHLGLGGLIAWRVARHSPTTFSIAVNDYGFELLSPTHTDWAELLPQVLRNAESDKALQQEVLDSLNAGELAQRRFREIARVAGLVFQGHPGEQRSSRQLQASSRLFWEVFRQYDPGNRLLHQAEQELLALELDMARLQTALARMNQQTLMLHTLERPTPFAFPLMVERFREKFSNENVAQRIARMVAQLEKAADGPSRRKARDKSQSPEGEDEGDVQAVLDTLDFGRDSPVSRRTGDRRPRRERKPPRPLPPL
ncbi:ATP-dependent Lhr-like helicase [Hydrogenophaga palleronii]|uniref:ATP-dependent Lhr-like helicase n=1 Tax=Hydrogenophaga palleronii TaxID=65655 RepID=A0ABU1WIT5_9BURK|nr:ligase-associated DNA damage response DEXH box helicase [Hydrogenophaga palleronii]MDR7148987.1 ATP-dependent Lhr-like helicase [Hydrogenophaga palleronii]